MLDIQVACRATLSVFEADETGRVVNGKCSRCRSHRGAWRVQLTPYKTSPFAVDHLDVSSRAPHAV